MRRTFYVLERAIKDGDVFCDYFESLEKAKVEADYTLNAHLTESEKKNCDISLVGYEISISKEFEKTPISELLNKFWNGEIESEEWLAQNGWFDEEKTQILFEEIHRCK